MNHLVLWASPIPLWDLPAPAWIWPVLVCLAAWLFRRHVLVNEGAGFRFRLLGGSMRISSHRPGGVANGHPAGGRTPRPVNLDGEARRVHWWNSFIGRAATSERVSVRARKALSPQLQFLILGIGNREYHILSQAGAAPLVLSTRNSLAPRAAQGMAAKRTAKSGTPRSRHSGLRQMTATAHRRPCQTPVAGQTAMDGLEPPLPGADPRGTMQHGVAQ